VSGAQIKTGSNMVGRVGTVNFSHHNLCFCKRSGRFKRLRNGFSNYVVVFFLGQKTGADLLRWQWVAEISTTVI
jgi:hypothetical protein